MNIAFEITNKLKHEGYLVEDLAPTKVQTLVESILRKDPRFRAVIIHLQDEWREESMPACHQVGNSLIVTDDSTVVTCQRCLGRIAMHKCEREKS